MLDDYFLPFIQIQNGELRKNLVFSLDVCFGI